MGLTARALSYASVQADIPRSSTEGDSIDEDYLTQRWSHTAKFLREFRQRKDAQAEEIRRHRASLQALTENERAQTMEPVHAAQSHPVSSLGVLEKHAFMAPDTRASWQDASSDQAVLPLVTAPRLKPSPTRGSGTLQPTWSNSGDVPAASTSSLDVLLQSVLQRSSAVSTKLTKTYAQAKVEEKDSVAEQVRSSHSLKKLASHARFDRARNQSRVHRQHTTKEPGGRDPSTHWHAQQQQQQTTTGRPQGSTSVVSPVGSRSNSPTGAGARESTLSVHSSLSQQPSYSSAQMDKPATTAVAAAAAATPGAGAVTAAAAAGGTSHDQELFRQARRGKAEGGAEQHQQPQRRASAGGELGELKGPPLAALKQQQRRSARTFTRRPHRASSGGGNSGRRGSRGPRAKSQSLDGQPGYRPDAPFFLGAEADGEGISRIHGLEPQPGERVVSSSGSTLRLPRLGQAEPKPVGAGPGAAGGVAGGGTAAAGGGGSSKSLGATSAGSSSSSGSGELPGRGATSAARLRPTALRASHQMESGSLRMGSSSMGSSSPSGRSPWAKSTTARELVFTQF